VRGRARARPLPHPCRHLQGGRGATPLSGRRDVTLAPSEAAGGLGARPGGTGGGHCDSSTKYSRSDFHGSGRWGDGYPPTTKFNWSDFNCSGRKGGGDPPTTKYHWSDFNGSSRAGRPTPGHSPDGVGLASSADLPAAWNTTTGSPQLVAVALVAGNPPPASVLRPLGGRRGAVGSEVGDQ